MDICKEFSVRTSTMTVPLDTLISRVKDGNWCSTLKDIEITQRDVDCLINKIVLEIPLHFYMLAFKTKMYLMLRDELEFEALKQVFMDNPINNWDISVLQKYRDSISPHRFNNYQIGITVVSPTDSNIEENVSGYLDHLCGLIFN